MAPRYKEKALYYRPNSCVCYLFTACGYEPLIEDDNNRSKAITTLVMQVKKWLALYSFLELPDGASGLFVASVHSPIRRHCVKVLWSVQNALWEYAMSL